MWGSACEDRAKARLSKPWEPAETLGSVAVHACKESRCFHSGVCQVFRATFSCLEVRCSIRGASVGHFRGKSFNFDKTTY